MARKKLDSMAVDKVLESMMDTVDRSKDEIFNIGEQCRHDHDSIIKELKEVKDAVLSVIAEGDSLEVKTRFARRRLSEVSQHFKDYSEDEVRKVYEYAHELQMRLSMNRQLEKQLRDRRDDLERRLLSLQETIERADSLVSQISIVSNYLTSDLKELGEALEDARLKQDFGLRIIEAQEEERKRLSREIHDGPAQMLANVLIRSDLAEKVHREKGPDEALKEIRSLKEMIRSALYEVRRIIYDLRPMALDDLGLVPTLKKYLATIEDYDKKTVISFTNLGEEKRLNSKYEVALFRLIQESVQNALKHAEAQEIKVKLQITRNNVTVIVKDNGKGFDQGERKNGSFGIMGMKERVEILEGEMSIDSKPGSGTIVVIQVPLID